MSDPSDDDIDDKSLFQQAVSGARKLEQDKIRPHRKRIKPIPRHLISDEQAALEESLAMPYVPDDIEVGDELLFSRNGVQNSVIRKLKKGQYPLEAELDLHRLTSLQAYEALVTFITQCTQRQIRCIRIIHGKGLSSKEKRPVLKGKVDRWLRQRDDILAFCSARSFDGGTGAVYVLLRRVP